MPLLWFMAVLSINLGLINLFPVPVLDGGHLLFYAAEAIRGKPLSQRAQEYGFRIGLALVLTLMVFATWNDLVHTGLVDLEALRDLIEGRCKRKPSGWGVLGANRATFRWLAVLAVSLAAAGGLPSALAQRRTPPAPPAAAPAGTIADVRIEGIQRIEPETVRSYLLLQPGDAWDAERVDRSLKALFATGLFADVKLLREGNTLVVRVVENPIINRIAFEGNSKISDKELNAEVQARARVVYTRTRVQNDVRRITELYRRQGRFAATVEPKIIQLPENRVDVVFEINEGPSTGVRAINFVGNRKFGDSTLRGAIETKESRWYRFLSTSDTYDPDRVAYDRELLRKFYLSEGYADFRVVSAIAELTPDRDAFILTFTVDEGERYRFGNVDVDIALKDLPREAVLPLLTVRPDEWYNAEAVERSISVLTDALGNRGYAFVEIRPEITRNREAHTVDIVFRVQEGPRVYVERIDITGNVRTLDKVIRREFRLVEGDPFNTTRMQRSKERIQNLGFFKKVEVTNAPGSAPDRTVVTRRRRGAIHRRAVAGCRFFQLRRPACRCSRTRAKFPRPRPGSEAWYRGFVPLATGRCQLHRAVFPRHEHRGRHRSVRDQDQPDQQLLHAVGHRRINRPPMAARCVRVISSPKICARPGSIRRVPTTSPTLRATPRCSFSCSAARA